MSTVTISAPNLVVNFVAILVRQTDEAAFPRCKVCRMCSVHIYQTSEIFTESSLVLIGPKVSWQPITYNG